jgi:hypothetical protein
VDGRSEFGWFLSQHRFQADVRAARVMRDVGRLAELQLDIGGGYMNEHKLQQLKEQRAEIRQLLTLFDRAAFRPDDGNNGGDPTAALNAIHETRVALAKGGAAFLSDENAAKFFRNLQDGLLHIEQQVQQKYPAVVDLAVVWRDKPINTQERLTRVKTVLGETYQTAAEFIREEAYKVYDSPEKARPILGELDRQIKQVIEQEDTAGGRTASTIIVIDQSQHINQSGGVSVQSAGDTHIEGDVVGRDNIGGAAQSAGSSDS